MIDQDITAASTTSAVATGSAFNSDKATVQIDPSDAAAFSVNLQAAAQRADGGARVWDTIGTFTQADQQVIVVDITPFTTYRFVHTAGSAVRVIMA